MPTVDNNTLLQTVFATFEAETNVLYTVLAEEVANNIANGMSTSKAVDKAFKDVEYTTEMTSIYERDLGFISSTSVKNTVITVAPKTASDYFMNTTFRGGNLSSKLNSAEAQNIVKTTLNVFFKQKTSVETLFKSLKDQGFNTVSQAKLPNKITRAISAFEDAAGTLTPEVKKSLEQARSYVSSLRGAKVIDGRTPEATIRRLNQQYNNVLNAIEKGDAKLVSNAISKATDAKLDYYNKRIARTEFGRAYEYSTKRAANEDPDIIGLQVLLSSGHEHPDICDCYADADMYGLGDGVCPVDAGVNIPFHPNCLCGYTYIRGGAGNQRKPQYSQKRVNEYLAKQPEQKRKSIVGASNATNQSNYQKGLEKNGFQITVNPKMIPMSIVEFK